MSNSDSLTLNDLTVLPQGGHGGYSIISTAMAPEPMGGEGQRGNNTIHILATLDSGANLILWDIITGKQIVDIPLLEWDSRRFSTSNIITDIATTKEAQKNSIRLIEGFNTQKIVNKGIIRTTKLSIQDDTLYAYGRNTLFTFNLPSIIANVKTPRPEQIRFFGGFKEIPFRRFEWMENEESGKWKFDPCTLGVLSSTKQHYLCIYTDEFKVKYFKIYDLKNPDKPPLDLSEKALKVPIESIVDIAFDDKSSSKKMILITKHGDEELESHFYSLSAKNKLKKQPKSYRLTSVYCLCPEATFVATLDGEHLKYFHRKESENFGFDFKNDNFPLGIPYSINLGFTNNSRRSLRGVLSYTKGLFTFKKDKGKQPILKREFNERNQRKRDYVLGFDAKEIKVILGPSELKKGIENQLLNKWGDIILIRFFEEGAPDFQIFNLLRPKIKTLSITKAYFKDNEGLESIIPFDENDAVVPDTNEIISDDLKCLNVVLDNNVIFSMLLGGSFRSKTRFLSKSIFQDISFNEHKDIIATLPIRKGTKNTNDILLRKGAKIYSFSKTSEETILQKIKFSPNGQLFAAAGKTGDKQFIDIFDATLWQELPLKEGWNKPIFQIPLKLTDNKTGKKAKTDIGDFSFHPEKNWVAIGQLDASHAAIITIFTWEKGEQINLSLLPFLEVVWLPSVKDFKLEFCSTGKYLILKTQGKGRIYEITETEEGVKLELLFRDKEEETKILGEKGQTKREIEQKRAVNFFSYGILNKFFEASLNSPFFLSNDNKILLERRDIEQIEIWEMTALLEQVKLHGDNRLQYEDTTDKVIKIDTFSIHYSSFLLLEEHSIIIFYRTGDEWIKMVDWESGNSQPIATIFPFGNKGFLMLDEHNHYFTNVKNQSLAAFLVKDTIFPLEQFDLMLNRPDLVLAHLKGLSKKENVRIYKEIIKKRLEKIIQDRFDQAFDLPEEAANSILPSIVRNFQEIILKPGEAENRGAQKIHLPEIKIKDFDNHRKQKALCIEASFISRSKADRPTRLNVYLNDVPLYGKEGVPLHWTKLALLMDNTSLKLMKCNNKLDVSLKRLDDESGKGGEAAIKINFDIHLDLSIGPNKIQVAILNADGIEHYQTGFINYLSPTEPPLPRVFFFGIAVGNHEAGGIDLNFMEPNLEKLIKAFHPPEELAELERKIHVTTLPALDKDGTVDNTAPKPTRAEIIKFLNNAKKVLKTEGATVEDKVVFYYGGHGVRREEDDWSLVLSCTDMDFDDKNTGVPYNLFEDFLDQIVPRRKLLLIDACASGEIDAFSVGETETTREKKNLAKLFNLMKNTFSDLRRGTGATILGASRGDKIAKEGVFVDTLIEGMAKQLKVSGFVSYMIREVPKKLIIELLKLEIGEGELFNVLIDKLSEEYVEVLTTETINSALTEKVMEITNRNFEEASKKNQEVADRLSRINKRLLLRQIIFDIQQPSIRAENNTLEWKIWDIR